MSDSKTVSRAVLSVLTILINISRGYHTYITFYILSYMLKRIVQQSNETKTISIPSALCDILEISKGDRLQFHLDGKKIIMIKEVGQ